jgi:glycosyltransferase involved in cell wall biosynthesis
MSLLLNPLISIIIPVYNGEQTIQETIESLLDQTYTHWELIIINDGSSDRTLEILAEILTQHPQVAHKIISYPQTGVCASRNRGASLAQGEFLAFLDADDLWSPDKLAQQLQSLLNFGVPGKIAKAAIAYSWTDYINEAGEFLYPGSHTRHQGDVYQQLLLGNFLENGSNALIYAPVFHEVGGFDESLVGGEEWDLFIRIARRYEFAVVPEVQVFYRLSNQSSSASLDRQAAECLKVIDRAFQASPPHLQHLKPQSLGNLYRYLTFRGLSSDLAYTDPRLLLGYFWQSLRHDPQGIFPRWQLLSIVATKLIIALLLPAHLAQPIITRLQKKR